jgi:hypothetical protein
VEPQQLATKVAQLESRVATLEDEGKIVKGEVKQILTEIRSAILVRDNPFDSDGALSRSAPPLSIVASQPLPAVEPPAPVPIPAPRPETPVSQRVEPPRIEDAPAAVDTRAREPIPLRPATEAPPPRAGVVAVSPAEQPQWSLLTIAGLAAWAEEAMSRLGALRLEILLDLCEAAGHLTPEARVALARVTELDIREPERTPSNNETVTILRQLDALVSDDEDNDSSRLQRLI